MDPLRILLVDDHLLFRKGLARLLDTQPDFEVVGEATDGLEGIEKARVLEPDVVLTDIEMPRLGGLEVTRRIKAQLSGVRVVVLTFSEDEQDLLAAVRCGADGYLLKDLTPEALIAQGIQPHTGGGAVADKNIAWRVAEIGDTAPAELPFLVSKNVEANELSSAKDENDKARITLMEGKPFGRKRAVWVAKGGGIFDARPKYLYNYIVMGIGITNDLPLWTCAQ